MPAVSSSQTISLEFNSPLHSLREREECMGVVEAERGLEQIMRSSGVRPQVIQSDRIMPCVDM